MTTTTGALDLPFDEAIAFFREKVATPTKSWRDVWNGAHSKMFMVAGANKKALVSDFQNEIGKALETGTTLADFRKGFDAIVKKHGWSYNGDRGWRTRTIFETNLRTAHAAGRYSQLTAPDTLATHPFWQYNHSGALHPRVQHQNWDGTVLAADDPFWITAYPPNGFGCGCFVTPVSRGRLRRLGKSGPDTAPDLDQVGTDQPRGVDPSFAYNPGREWLDRTAPGPKTVRADEANVAAFVVSALKGKWPDGAWTPVSVLDRSIVKGVGRKGDELRLHADTIRANQADEATSPAAYGVIPRRLLREGEIVDRDGATFLQGVVDGERWEMQIEADQGERHVRLLRLVRIAGGA